MRIEAQRPAASVLIVEDDRQVSDAVRRYLMRTGLTVFEPVDDGAEALRRVAKQQPDLVIVDIGLIGRIDGLEAAQKMKDMPPYPALIFLTAASDETSLARSIAAGAVGYILKPFSPSQLLTSVRLGLALRQGKHVARQDTGPAVEVGHERLGAASSRQTVWQPLTAREQEIVRLVVAHHRPRLIAQSLGISYHTVRNHLKQIYRKLGVSSLIELVTLATLNPPRVDRPSHS
jgi:two-component system nitrate/nitrite response regulator NarL